MRAAYNVGPLYAAGDDGRGQTIAIIDSFGNDTMANDLHVFDQAFGLQPMCGETGVTCAPGMPTFSELGLQGSPATKQQGNGNGNGTGLQDKTGWALEVVLDVEWAHAIAPGANILLVHTPVAETLGVQGFPQMIKAEDYVVKNHLATVISQSLASSENAFGSTNEFKQSLTPADAGAVFPFPNVGWPASDPLVTAVGGTYLCTDPNNTASRVVDSADPPTRCQANPGQAEVGWIDSGGGFSQVFARPDYQNTLPAGSTAIPGNSRGVPDVSYQGSATTGALIYISLPPAGLSGIACGPNPCSTGWYVIGGTSAGAPQWSGLVAIADQINGGGLGLINPALYKIGADATRYAKDFFDVTTGNNQAFPPVPGYPATTGWDPVTGLGSPNAANLLPDLVSAVHGH
jgi:subtilase family serine protease